MGAPSYEDSTRADLANTGTVFDGAMKSSASDTLAQNLRGTESARGLLAPDQSFEQGLGGQDTGMAKAIQNKYSGIQGAAQRDFQQAEKLNAKAQHFEKLQHASQLVGHEMQQNYQKALAKYEAEQRRKAARAGLVGNVLGIVVGVVAEVYTGGATGGGAAAAGYAAGNAAGNAIGGG